MAPETASEASLPAALLRFVRRLRSAGVPVSLVEAVDAARALGQLEISDRAAFKAALAATLIKRGEDWPAFERLFEEFFRRRRNPAPPKPLARNDGSETAEAAGAAGEDMPANDLLEAILSALRHNDTEALRLLARVAAQQYGRIDPDRSQSERYYLYRIMRQLDVSAMLQRALHAGLEDAGQVSELELHLAREEQLRRIEEFRRLIAEAIQLRLAEMLAVATSDDPDPRGIEDVDFLKASVAELEQMRAAVRPLARKLAARLASAERRRRRGRLDVRRTVRRSLGTGGVPVDPAFRRRKASKPDIWLLCDVSGSVAPFAEFTLSLLNAMNQEFARIRSFAFIDGIEEVTELFAAGETVSTRQVMWRTGIVRADGHSDYGQVFSRFWKAHGAELSAGKSTVIITGDARNNFRALGIEDLQGIAGQARRVYWLNPEPRGDWDGDDSVQSSYADCCQAVLEVRNLRQLSEFVASIDH